MKILWICFVWPEPTSSAAGVRTTELIKTLINAGHQVQACSPCQPNDFMTKLSELGVVCQNLPANHESFDTFIKQYDPAIVFFDRFMIEEQFGWRVREHCPDAVRILDSIDLHSLRRARQSRFDQGLNVMQLSASDLSSEDACREISSIYRCDLSLLISDFELKFLREKYNIPEALLQLCRYCVEVPESILDFSARSNFVAIGNFNHAPNLDCFKFLQESLWGKIRAELEKLGTRGVELHIYGAYPKADFLKFDNSTSGFRVKGWTPDVRDTLGNYRVNLAPLRFGAGIKGKILDGWSLGTPCVASSLAAEGIIQGSEFGGIVADDWNEFARQAALLYTQKENWLRFQRSGLQLLRRCFDAEINAREFLAKLETTFKNFREIRNNNFTGNMLWYHQLRSTEYFSRWIEVKNRKAPNIAG